jgi:hypothetical protein
MTDLSDQWNEQRREHRRPVTGLARMAQRTRIILGADEQVVQQCKILDASDNGYRIGSKPMPKLEIGNEFILEHTDGSRRRVCVCWVSEHEVGLKVVDPDQDKRS